jgi:hypothetical protein
VTDPRIAALAEALQSMTEEMPGVLAAADMENEPPQMRGIAAAILAALPPGWCGHAAKVYALRVKSRGRRDENDWQKGFRQGWNEAIAAAKAAIVEAGDD